ncbi:hypothetical protein CHELA1G11_20872 [Hyphomicrobiales bacterium]|nr:hypothetical protein CHELA1G11_20872 [Hyphomicrobiales bacterium]CAH1692366.1 hypothetical protein CHELA1G2_21189 [Hyphomicrobiales bacterium]
MLDEQAMAASLKTNGLRRTHGGSVPLWIRQRLIRFNRDIPSLKEDSPQNQIDQNVCKLG